MRSLLIPLAFFGATTVSWAGLVNTQVTGSLTFNGVPGNNFFNSSAGFVPTGCVNSGLGSATVTVSASNSELCFQSPSNRIIADFTDTFLFFTNNQASPGGVTGFVATFTFAPGLVTGVTEANDSYPAGMNFAFANNVLTLTYAGNGTTLELNPGARYNFTFGSVNEVPEPSTPILFFAGLTGAALLRRLRRQ